MVSKSYVVNQRPAIREENTTQTSENNELVKCEMNEKMHANNSNNNEQKKIFDRYILQISHEMVKMKPKSMFYDEKNSATNFWTNNRSGIIRWNRECIEKAKSKMSVKMLVKFVILIIILIFFGFVLLSWLSSEPSRRPQQPYPSHKTMSTDETSSPATTTTTTTISIKMTSMTEEESTQNKFNNLQKTAEFESTTAPIRSSSAPNTISNFDHHSTEKSPTTSFNADDDAASLLLTKKYVERINFYTTSNKNLFSVKVSPTLPSIRKHHPTSSELPIQNYANENSCQSTSLPLCQGVLSYDLTDPQLKWNLTNIEYQHFQHLLESECSKRAADFVCHMLEPECRSTRMKNLKPCRRICKGIFESCSHIIASSEVLTEFFDCNTYTDSHDQNVCEDITRFSKKCFDDEFQCSDYSCIPSKWRCDNIRDCSKGEDEDDCKFCNYDQFRCVADGSCITEKYYCDGFEDCIDGSDETNCDIGSSSDEEVVDDKLLFSYYDDDEGDYENEDGIEESATLEADHNDSDGDKIVSTGDGVKPIFVNPNVTITAVSSATSTSTVKIPKRFRTTLMRNFKQQIVTTSTTTTTEMPTTSTTRNSTSDIINKHESENAKASTSHSSPCPEFELRCVDGLCITLDQICDKVQDCTDNADELHCEY